MQVQTLVQNYIQRPLKLGGKDKQNITQILKV